MIFICLKIFLARIFDVTLGSVRTILMVKGKSITSAILAFLEVFIWFVIAKEALLVATNSILIPVFYSAGYATGTLIGTYISNNYLDGLISIQAITSRNNKKLINKIRKEGYGISVININNNYEKKKKDMLLIELNKKRLKYIINIIREIDPEAFIIVNESKFVQNGFIK